MDTSLEQLILTAKEAAIQVIDLLQQEHEPTLLIASEGKIRIAQIELFSAKGKEAFFRNLPQILRDHRAQAYVLILESWASCLPKDSPTISRLDRGEISVRELPLDDREEILNLLCASNGNDYKIYQAKIRKDYTGRRLLPFEDISDWEVSGRAIIRSW